MKKSLTTSLLISQILFFSFLPIWLQLTRYLHPLVILVIWFCVSVPVFLIVSLVKKEKIFVSKRLLQICMALYSIGLFVLLFFRPHRQGSYNLIPFDTIRYYLSGEVEFLIALYNVGANIGLFIPFGIYYGLVKMKPSWAPLLMITLASIVFVEFLQYITRRGSLDIDDLLLNSFGVILGYMLFPFIKKVLFVK